MLIYVTGKSGSGKSTFSKKLAEQIGYKYIDVDLIGHKIYENRELINKLTELFGNAIYDENGIFNRKMLGKVVFSQIETDNVKLFSDLTWDYMKQLLNLEMDGNCVIDWISLPKTEYWKLPAKRILIVANNNELRLEKLILRDKVSKEYLLMRERASMEYNLDDFDIVFENTYKHQDINDFIDLSIKKLKINIKTK